MPGSQEGDESTTAAGERPLTKKRQKKTFEKKKKHPLEKLTPRQEELRGREARSGAHQQLGGLPDREAVEERVDDHQRLGDADDEEALLERR